MKNKLRAFVFACVVVVGAFAGMYMIRDADNIVKNGQEFRFKLEKIDDRGYHSYDGRCYTPDIATLYAPYTRKIPLVEKYIKDNAAEKEPLKNLFFSINPKVYVALARDSEGFAAVKSYSEKPPRTGAYIATETDHYETAVLEGDKWVKLEKPRLRFDMPSFEMTLSKKQLERIDNYLKTIKQKERKGYVVAKVKNGKIIPIDIVVNQKSLLGL